MSERDNQEELQKAFILFGQNKDHITLQDLKRIAVELGEILSDDQLREMMLEANIHWASQSSKQFFNCSPVSSLFLSFLLRCPHRAATQGSPRTLSMRVVFVLFFRRFFV